MNDDGEKVYKGSPCHGATMTDEDIYESTKTGRKVLGHIAICLQPVRRDGAKSFCYKPCRPVVPHKGGRGLPEAWSEMLRAHPYPPYYFVRDTEGRLRPESGLAPLNKERTEAPDPVEFGD